jgi:nucleoside-diphosphate-sugar epimerase
MLTEQANKLTIFGGGGFIGNRFHQRHSDAIVRGRNDLVPATNQIISFISTVDNYGIYTNPYLDIETNLTLLVRILEKAKEKFGNDFTFTFASSWFVYGASDPVAKETSPCNPTGFYSSTKLCAERLLTAYCQTFGIRYKILRFSNVIGVGDKKASLQKNAFQYLAQEIIQNRDVSIYKDPSFRSFIDVDDLVSAIDLCMSDARWNEIYNIGNETSYNVKKLLWYVYKRAKSKSRITEIDVPNFHKIVQVKNFRMDISKLKGLGYCPKFTIRNTIDRIINHYQ